MLEIKELFDYVDTNSDGYISASELKAFIESQLDQEVNKQIQEADVNGDGKISLEGNECFEC